MPPDLPNEQELVLKKRARRRLVGAIALVLLMVIVLPQVLQDRAAMTQQEAIKITMPGAVNAPKPEPAADKKPVELPEAEVAATQQEAVIHDESIKAEINSNVEPTIESIIASKDAENKKAEARKSETPPPASKVDKKLQVKTSETKTADVKNSEIKVAESKKPEEKPEVKISQVAASQNQSEHFTVQVGVYSDVANVKRLQDQLKQAGFSTYTEKITTPKGESIRLKAGNFTSRQDAVNALGKLKEIGLSGIIIGND